MEPPKKGSLSRGCRGEGKVVPATWLQVPHFHGELRRRDVIGCHQPVAASPQAFIFHFKGGDGGAPVGPRDPRDVDGGFRCGGDGGAVGSFGD